MVDKKTEEKQVGSALMIFFGVFATVGGINLFLMNLTMNFMGGDETFLLIGVGIGLIALGVAMIISAKEYNFRFILGAVVLFVYAGVIFFIYRTFIPRMKEMGKDFSETEELTGGSGSSVSVFNPADVNFALYETLMMSLVIIFIVAGIALLIIYAKYYSAKAEPEAKFILLE